MALELGVNSFGTVAEADAYFSDRLDSELWAVTNTRKEQALISATRILADFPWNSVATGDVLPFPAEGEYFSTSLGKLITFSGTPDLVKYATFEVALHLLRNTDLLSDTGSVDSLSMEGVGVLTKIKAPSKVPLYIKTMIRPLLKNSGRNLWWRAN